MHLKILLLKKTIILENNSLLETTTLETTYSYRTDEVSVNIPVEQINQSFKNNTSATNLIEELTYSADININSFAKNCKENELNKTIVDDSVESFKTLSPIPIFVSETNNVLEKIPKKIKNNLNNLNNEAEIFFSNTFTELANQSNSINLENETKFLLTTLPVENNIYEQTNSLLIEKLKVLNNTPIVTTNVNLAQNLEENTTIYKPTNLTNEIETTTKEVNDFFTYKDIFNNNTKEIILSTLNILLVTKSSINESTTPPVNATELISTEKLSITVENSSTEQKKEFITNNFSTTETYNNAEFMAQTTSVIPLVETTVFLQIENETAQLTKLNSFENFNTKPKNIENLLINENLNNENYNKSKETFLFLQESIPKEKSLHINLLPKKNLSNILIQPQSSLNITNILQKNSSISALTNQNSTFSKKVEWGIVQGIPSFI